MVEFFSYICLILVSSSSTFADINVTTSVLELTEENFHETLNSYTSVLVEFYAPWCSFCKDFEPIFAEAAELLKKFDTNSRLAKVDATTQTNLSQIYEIKGYPTLMLFKGDKRIEYNWEPNANDIVSWLRKKSGIIIDRVDSLEEYNGLAEKHNLYIIVLDKDPSSISYTAVKSVADHFDFPFYHCDVDIIFNTYGLEGKTKIILKKNFEEPTLVYEGPMNFEEMSRFLRMHHHPNIVQFTEADSVRIFGGEIKKHFLFFAAKSDENFKFYEEMLRNIVEDYREWAQIVVVDCDVQSNEPIMSFFGITEDECPIYRLVEFKEENEMIKFKPTTSKVSSTSMRNFFVEVIEGRMEPFYKSEDLPQDWDKKPVKVLVKNNFDEVARGGTDPVFVTFYAASCPRCQSLMPIWEKLGKEFKDRRDVLIAKIDVSANEIPSLKLESLPTIKFYPNNGKEVTNYTGEQTLKAMKKFLESELEKLDKEETENVKEEL